MDDCGDRVLVEEVLGHAEGGVGEHLVDVPARLDHGNTLGEGHDGTTLVGGSGVVRQHTDDQPVTVSAGLPQERDVARVEQVPDHVDVDARGGRGHLRV